jgi:hypothetical protein
MILTTGDRVVWRWLHLRVLDGGRADAAWFTTLAVLTFCVLLTILVFSL